MQKKLGVKNALLPVSCHSLVLSFFLTAFFLCITSLGMAHPVIIYDGDVNDGSYNKSLHTGIQEFQKQTGRPCIEIETRFFARDYLKTVMDCISKKYSPIILTYNDKVTEIIDIVNKHKNTGFILLDHGEIDRANVWSFSFAEHEGCFLAGALAAFMTKSKKIGFIYASDQYPVLLRFRAGYIQGCHAVDPTITVLERQLGFYPEVWKDAEKGRKMAAELIAEGADVLFAAAGFAGTGVLAEAADKKIYAIGVDSNQNHLYPGTMIGSMLKRSDKAVFIALNLAFADIHRDGIKRLGVAQDAVGIEFEGVVPGLVPQEVKDKLQVLKSEIVIGKRKVQEELPLSSE